MYAKGYGALDQCSKFVGWTMSGLLAWMSRFLRGMIGAALMLPKTITESRAYTGDDVVM